MNEHQQAEGHKSQELFRFQTTAPCRYCDAPDLVPVSPAELARIADYVGVAKEEALREYCRHEPLYRYYPRVTLKAGEDGRCPFAKDGQPEADFIRCKAFGGAAKFANDYLGKGIKINVCGQLQTRTYDAEDGHRNFVTEVLVESQEFAESAAANRRIAGSQAQADTAPAGPAELSEPACGGYNPETDHDFGDAELPFS